MDDRHFRKALPNFQFTAVDDGLRQTIEYYERIHPY
jgi:hypothetical protein